MLTNAGNTYIAPQAAYRRGILCLAYAVQPIGRSPSPHSWT